mgnify:CR=1 FL=1
MRRVIDGAPAAVEHVNSRYPGLETSPDEAALFDDDVVDAVVIATPATDHYRAARKSLQSGKHTFVEKPLAMNTAEAEALVRLADEEKLVLMVGHTFLYNSAVQEVKNLIDSGDLGDIYYIYSRRVNLGTVRQDVNVLWNLAPHDISIINYWLDDEATSAAATGGTFLQKGIEDVVFATLSFDSGAVALAPFDELQGLARDRIGPALARRHGKDVLSDLLHDVARDAEALEDGAPIIGAAPPEHHIGPRRPQLRPFQQAAAQAPERGHITRVNHPPLR